MLPVKEEQAMSELDSGMGGASDEQASEASGWIERLTDASSDFEVIGAEVAAGLGL